MLQRAASNAYSWWWASHIRTKQSKWLEQSLQDMGEKVAAVLQLLQADGDSFIKRAEMYYKKRPEFISFVEESYKAYRSLAERYELLSKELQNANSTLASAFPEQFQYSMDDDSDEEFSSPRPMPKRFDKLPIPITDSSPNIPKAPPAKFPTQNIKAIIALASTIKKANSGPKGVSRSGPKSGLTSAQALQEIDKLQKTILVLQTEKEFAKSTYESGQAKCWKIEEDITGMQDKISKLQDEFEISQPIEDEEARALMAGAALRSCNETLVRLEENHEKAASLAKAESIRIKDAQQKVRSLKGEFSGTGESYPPDAPERGHSLGADNKSDSLDEGDGGDGSTKSKDLEVIRDKIKEHFDMGPTNSLSVTEMAEKIDELVSKVIDMESSVSSQTALIHTLRSETDELQTHINSLEDDKANLIDGKNNLSDILVEMESKLKELQDVNHSLEKRNSSLETHLTEAQSKMDMISEKLLQNLKPDDNIEELRKFQESGGLKETMDVEKVAVQDMSEYITLTPSLEEKTQKTFAKLDSKTSPPSSTDNDQSSTIGVSQPQVPAIQDEQSGCISMPKHDQDAPSGHYQEQTKEEGEPDWQKLFTDGLEGKEKALLLEYTNTLRNYKEVKKEIRELEKKSQNDLSDIASQNQELINSNANKDAEIQSLRQKLSALQNILDECRNQKELNNVVSTATKEEILPPPKDIDDIEIIAPERREVSPVEEKLRADIDEILEKNLDFWIRFSGTFGLIQKFHTGVRDLQAELANIEKQSEKKEGSGHGSSHGGHQTNANLQSDVKPIYKHLKEIQTELTVWLQQSEKLKDELQSRFSQLCNIQEEIKHALDAGAETDEMKFTSFQAAKFQGEVANMQQENHKVGDELQAGMDHITSLQQEVEHTIARLNKGLGLSGSKNLNENQIAGVRGNAVPLRSFIFGVKPQKKKQSIFSSMQHMHRKHYPLKPDK